MKRARIGIIATAVLAVATMAFAQRSRTSPAPGRREARSGGRPAAPAGGGGGGGGGMGGGPMTVKQTADRR